MTLTKHLSIIPGFKSLSKLLIHKCQLCLKKKKKIGAWLNRLREPATKPNSLIPRPHMVERKNILLPGGGDSL